MEEPVHVTKIAERKPEYNSRTVLIYNIYPGNVVYNPWEDFPELHSLSVHKDNKEKAKKLSLKFHGLGPRPAKQEAKKIVEELLNICEKPYEKLTPTEKWGLVALHMPEDIGGLKKEEEKNILTSKAKGRVLETMCGFNSYFSQKEDISEIIAMDFCNEMLERYEYPERTRILYDLERVVKGEKISFFEDRSFDTIGCWGTNYLTELTPVFHEFGRLLRENGRLLVLESTTEGYIELVKRFFDPKKISDYMKEAGLNPVVTRLHELNTNNGTGEFYLVEGKK